MTSFGARLGADLARIADHAAVTESGWAQIVRRIDTEADDVALEVDVELLGVERGNGRRRRQFGRGLLGAAALIVVAVLTVSLLSSVDRRSAPAQEAEQVITDYVDAFNAGDVDRAIGLFADDADLPFRQESAATGHDLTVPEWGLQLEFYAAQGGSIVDDDCVVVETATGGATVTCQWRLNDAVTIAAGQPGDRVETEFTVVDQQIVALAQDGDWFTEERRAFVNWVLVFHPDDDELFVWPSDLTVEGARQLGELATTLAQEWAAQRETSPVDG